ncbi:amino acid adenylation domain-containing protein [Cryptosporangium sp. NPDC051539]|uniref:amino acid adenylation domain-containing protein n=1 Tax=Cryptosporangium sp. NPDC051539 TaxID=3363962 RepID=UPI0037A1A02B
MTTGVDSMPGELATSRAGRKPAAAGFVAVHRRFAHVAERCPGRIAVVSAGRRLTYRELAVRVERLAARLAAAGLVRGGAVGVLVDDAEPSFVVAALAIWRAGGIYLPIDPGLPAARRARMLADIGPVAVVAPESLRPAWPDGPVPLLSPEDPDDPEATEDTEDHGAVRSHRPGGDDIVGGDVVGDDIAYIVHTSGSTGEPKPVAVSHRALDAACRGWDHVHDLTGSPGTTLQAAGPSFDVHVGDLVRTLCFGGRLVLCPRPVLLDPEALWRLIDAESVQILELTPAVIRLLVDWVAWAGRRLASVRLFASGGDQWRAADYRRLRAVLPADARVLNTYGVSEATIDSTFHDVSEESLEGDVIPIGCPFPDVEIAVLDADRRPVATGEPGELYLAGPWLAVGYHGRPAATAERFVAHPSRPGERMYRTGDLVRQRADGALVHLGRLDDEVKVRGVRISLGGIEATLARHDEVADAAVVLHRADGKELLTAHVTLAPLTGTAPDPAQRLRAYLAAQLPAAAVPAAVLVHRALPLTPSGKVDRAALARPAPDRELTPAGEIERKVAAEWRALLGRPPRDRAENLFEAGGDSLSAARLAMAIQHAFSLDFTVGQVMSGASFGELADAVAAAGAVSAGGAAAAGGANRAGGPRASGLDTAPLTLGQHSLWLLHQFDRTDPTYHLPTVVRLTGTPSVDAVRAALDRLVERHDALRCRVEATGEGARLRVEPRATIPFDVLDAGHDPDAVIADLVRRPFDLSTAPLIRAALVRHRADRHDLVLVVHHLVFDDWSERVVLRELGRLYTAEVTGVRADLPAPRLRITDVAAWRAERVSGPAGTAQREHWRRALAGLPGPLDLPGPMQAPPHPGPGNHHVELDPELTRQVRATASSHRVSPNVTMLAALSVLLRRWSGRPDLVVGVPFGHRDRTGTEDLVGFLVSTLPVRLRVEADAPFAQVLSAAARRLAEASSNADLPIELLLHDLGVEAAERNRLFRVWFNWLGTPAEPPAMASLSTRVLPTPPPGALFDLCCYVTERGDRLRLDLVYDPGALDAPHVAEFARQYALLLGRLCAEPDRPVCTHSLVTDVAAALLPTGTADLRTTAPALVGRLAATAAERAPDVALRGPGGTTSYAGLYALAGAWSATLAAAGVGPGDVVPIHAARVVELVPAVLGVLGAGAAVSILDEEHPPSRLARQVETLGATTGVRVAAELPDELRTTGLRWLDAPDPGAAGASWPARTERDGAAAYVAFTSGSSGRPEAVSATRAPLGNFLAWYPERYELTAADRFALLAGLGHDPLLRDVFVPLALGASLAVPPPPLLRDPVGLLGWLAAESTTVLHATPALCRLLSVPPAPTPLAALRLVCCAGDLLQPTDVDGIRRWAPNATVVNAYGTTETPQIVSHAEVDAAPTGRSPLPVGRGVPGAELLVTDAEGRSSGIGEVGTITVRSPYLATGFRAERPGFAADPVSNHRRFVTGDVGRYRPDGSVTVLGRRDTQVQVRGFRVELGEIDRWLRAHPGLRDAAAAARPGADGDLQIVASVVPAPGHPPPDADAIRAFLRRALPDYMLPVEVRAINAVPLTPNGKIDRRRLAEDTAETGLLRAPAARPVTDLERLVTTIWQQVLAHERVGAEQNFRELGATSVLMARAHVELQRVTGRLIPITALFEHSTVRSLALFLAGGGAASPPAAAPRTARHLPALRQRRLAARAAARSKETTP